MKISNILYFTLLAFVISCKSKNIPEPVVITNTKEVTHVVRDTIFKTEADSAFYNAFVECVNGRPVINPKTVSSKRGKSLIEPQVHLKGNKLSVKCEKLAESLFKQWRETYIKQHEQKPIYVPRVEYREKPFTTWQKIQLWFGRVFMGILALFLSIGVLRWRKVI
ncbi:hypothetical protein [Riemerella anatipestifer]|uniref:hypothetical protein n=1 Tax=Riemerella anatipestifer TaxID=34085 RepID=UPI001372813E|nr:hypothetical protein [Riemerella anatipestifer]MBT0550243.1 hypothetical protein [Riemerella anatipestifer]MBT0556967.1 hypothetical protein [Riemerella anatipestifer]MBT0561003.1 hypothetical protein [Riemerella anatipestifer]NAV17326.1 hypothetical protein [Riemerella anatipestifer]